MKTVYISDTPNLVGKEVVLYAWVNTVRDHKKIVFLDLRDRSGIVQAVGGDECKGLSMEDVVEVTGLVKERPGKMANAKIKTGSVEIEIKKVIILNKSNAMPIPVTTDGYEIDEEARLKYRYLDMRRPRLAENLAFRSQFIKEIREFYYKNGFIEVETPILSESTPEGARDFIIPARLQQGKFYALPQSPQQYKQLLMVGGIEKYFQIARCFRDEDPRADRAYGEFTQLDLEMSFVEREDVMALTEKMIIEVYEKFNISIKQKPFPRYTYKDAIKQFGADKFDLRTEEDKKNKIQAFAWVVDFPFFEKTEEGGWTFTHNPFSAPLPEYKKQLLEKKDIGGIFTTQYDLVCNGYEVGGGSIRAHEPQVLKTVFEIMGYSEQDIQSQFGHMLEALGWGAPPHGGIAPGIDRLLTCIRGEVNLREVMAFPMTSGGRTSVMNAPSVVADDKLLELGIKVTSKPKQNIYELIVSLLKKHSIEGKTIEHTPVFTSEEAANVRNTKLSQGAKAMIMYAEDKPMMLVLPADKKVDMKLFKINHKCKDLRMATPEEVEKISGVKVGTVPPFGNLFGIPLYVDPTLGNNEEIVFNAGSHTKSIIMKYADFVSVTKPQVEVFSK